MKLPTSQIIRRTSQSEPPPIQTEKHLNQLIATIEKEGIRNPFLITPEKVLIKDDLWFTAVKRLKIRRVPVRIIDVKKVFSDKKTEKIEADLSVSEKVAIGLFFYQEYNNIYRTKYAKFKAKRKAKSKASGRYHSPSPRDVLAPYLRLSNEAYYKATKVIEAAYNYPDEFGHLVSIMDSTNNVAGAHRKLIRPNSSTIKNVLKQKALNQKTKFINRFSTIIGLVEGLTELDIAAIMLALTDDEAAAWEKHSRDIVKTFQKLTRQLGGRHGNSSK